jgi:hypothetical protein
MRYLQIRHAIGPSEWNVYKVNHNLNTEKNEKVNFNNINDCRVLNTGT